MSIVLQSGLVTLVGSDRFYEDEATLELYSKDHSFVSPRKALCVVKPKDTDQIKEIIDLANKTKMPIIPISSGPPRFHGDTVPTGGGVCVDLSELNQIVRVDRRNRIAVIEPGVTFDTLRSALEAKGMVPYTPLLPRSTKSVLASFLEREPITIPKDHWDFCDPLVGGEIVFGNGHIQRFGDTAQGSKREVGTGEIIPVHPLGPSSIDWLRLVQGSQGTLGIVSWASIYCRIKSCIQRPFLVAAQNLGDLLPFTEKVLRRRIVEEFFILNSFSLANVLAEEGQEIKTLQASLPAWVLFLNIAGYERHPEEKVEYKEEQVREMATQERLQLKGEVGGVSALAILGILGKTAKCDRRLRYKGSCQVLPFETTLDRTPGIAHLTTEIAGEHGYPTADLSIYIQPIIQGCQCQCEVVIPYEPQDGTEVEKVKSLFMDIAEKIHSAGAYYSRPYGMLANIVYRDAEITSVLRKIKMIFDPNDIMNSGKLCF